MVSSTTTKLVRTVEEVDIPLPDVVEDEPSLDSGFDPGAHFDQWFLAVETFRIREHEERVPGVLLNGSELDYGTGGSFDDQLADKLEIPGTLVVAEHGMLQGDVTVTVRIRDNRRAV